MSDDYKDTGMPDTEDGEDLEFLEAPSKKTAFYQEDAEPVKPAAAKKNFSDIWKEKDGKTSDTARTVSSLFGKRNAARTGKKPAAKAGNSLTQKYGKMVPAAQVKEQSRRKHTTGKTYDPLATAGVLDLDLELEKDEEEEFSERFKDTEIDETLMEEETVDKETAAGETAAEIPAGEEFPEAAEELPETDEIPETEKTSATEALPEIIEIPETEEMPEKDDLPETDDLPEMDDLPEIEVLPEAESLPETEVWPEADPLPETEVQPEAEGLSEPEKLPDPEAQTANEALPVAGEASPADGEEESKRESGERSSSKSPSEDSSGKPPRKKSLVGKILLGILAFLVAGVAVVYAGTAIWFRTHFYPHTFLNGQDISLYDEDQVRAIYEQQVGDYQLTLTERDGSEEVLTSQDMGLQLVWNSDVADMLSAQNGFDWPLYYFDDYRNTILSSETIVSFEEATMESSVSKLHCMSAEAQVEPVNAYISEYNADTGYTIVPEEEGTVVKTEDLYKAIGTAVNGLQENVDLVEAGLYTEPEIREDNEQLVEEAAVLNKYAGTVITFAVGSDQTVLDGSTISQWLTVEEGTGEVTISAEGISDYVDDLYKKYTTCYTTRSFKTSYGNTVSLSGYYGWKVDKTAEQEEILKEIQEGAVETRDLNYSSKASSHDNDWGDSYVEVSIAHQHLFLYKEGKLVMETDVVTGNTSKDRGTDTGIFCIAYCQRNATLKGEDYETPVSYWMPFNDGQGLHDASWRSSFGGSIYKTSGSHGCVNMPVSAAAKAFSYVYAGYPVIVY